MNHQTKNLRNHAAAMTVRKYLYPLLIWLNMLFFIPVFSVAQDSNAVSKPIKEILIIGNEHTGENVIRRELLVKVGEIPKTEQLDESKRRLQNLYLFNRVELAVVPLDETYDVLIIDVTERLYFYPVPIFSINERDWSKISYGLALVHMNLRGQNERLAAGFWLGYRPGFALNYTDTWAADSLHLTTEFSTSKYTYNHRTLDIEEHHWTNQISAGKWWSLYFLSQLTLKFENIQVDQQYADLMHSGKSGENQLGIELYLRHDTRDLYFYPSSGWFNRIFIYQNGLFQDYDKYEAVTVDNRLYLPVGPLILAGRYYQTYLFGEVPIYRLNYIGFDNRIRGYFYTQAEGRHINIGSIEIRFPIFPIVYYSFTLPPIPEQYLKNLKLGLSGSFFIDTGIIWNKSYQYGISNFITGCGVGLNLHLPYVEIFRFDYAFNHEFRGQLILETGIAF
jgi:outer membrane protein assembly factor BamA